jgi:hypothetical protein
MSATRYDFSIEQGTSFKLSLVYKDSNGNPIDLTDWCARLVWKTNKNVTQSFITTNTDYSVYKFTIEPLIGKLTLLIPPETTNLFNFAGARYDLELQSDYDLYAGGGKNIIRLLYGNITLLRRYSSTSDLLECEV